MNKARIYWIDNIKFFLIVCVIIGHHKISGDIGEMITRNIIFSFHMPLFFFLNGLTKKNKDIDVGEFINKKIRNLLIPYFVTVLISIITASYLRNSIFVQRLQLTNYSYDAKVIADQCLLRFEGFSLLWFVPCLFICELLFILTKDYLMKINIVLRYICLYFIGIIGVLLSQYSIGRFFCAGQGLIVLLFVYLGYDYKFFVEKVRKSIKISFFVYWIYLYINLIKIKKYIDIGSYSFPDYPLCVIEAIGAIFLIVYFFSKTKKIKFVSFIGKNSFIVYLVHAVEHNFIPWDNIKERLYKNFDRIIFVDIFTLVMRISIIIMIVLMIIYIKQNLMQIIQRYLNTTNK